MGGEGRGQPHLHLHPAGEVSQLSIQRQVELPHQLFLKCAVPSGIEGLQISEKILYRHPIGHLLVFRDVADRGKLALTKPPPLHPPPPPPPPPPPQDVHQHLT